MKQIFRCEYCDETDIEEVIKQHEETCLYNHNKKSCFTCRYRTISIAGFICNKGKEIAKGKYIEQCPNYEWDEKDHANRNIFGSFKGFF